MFVGVPRRVGTTVNARRSADNYAPSLDGAARAPTPAHSLHRLTDGVEPLQLMKKRKRAATPPPPAAALAPPPAAAMPAAAAAPAPAVAGPANIREANSPGVDRITLQKDWNLNLNVTNLPGGENVSVKVRNAGDTYGKVTLDGAKEKKLGNGNHAVAVRGTQQTGNTRGTRLVVRATHNGGLLYESAKFAVAALPQDWTCTFDAHSTDKKWVGYTVRDQVGSDSGNAAHLDGLEIKEEVQSKKEVGGFKGTRHKNSGWQRGDGLATDDHMSGPPDQIAIGSMIQHQTSQYRDYRSDNAATAHPVANSGFEIEHKVEAIVNSAKLRYTITKTGADAKANGVTSKAGATGGGPISKSYDVP